MAADLYDTKKAPVYGRVTSSVRHLLLAVVALAGCEVAQSDEHATMYLAGYDHCLVTMAEDGAVEANKADGSTPAEICTRHWLSAESSWGGLLKKVVTSNQINRYRALNPAPDVDKELRRRFCNSSTSAMRDSPECASFR